MRVAAITPDQCSAPISACMCRLAASERLVTSLMEPISPPATPATPGETVSGGGSVNRAVELTRVGRGRSGGSAQFPLSCCLPGPSCSTAHADFSSTDWMCCMGAGTEATAEERGEFGCGVLTAEYGTAGFAGGTHSGQAAGHFRPIGRGAYITSEP